MSDARIYFFVASMFFIGAVSWVVGFLGGRAAGLREARRLWREAEKAEREARKE
jgi:hypothetical protein